MYIREIIVVVATIYNHFIIIYFDFKVHESLKCSNERKKESYFQVPRHCLIVSHANKTLPASINHSVRKT